MSKPFEDECIQGWTDDNIAEHFAFDSMPDEIRHTYVVLGCWCIVKETRRGVSGFRTSDMRQGGKSLRTRTKRAATRIAKLIDKDCYGG